MDEYEQEDQREIPHFGHTVRGLFFTAGLIFVACYPFFKDNLNLPILFAIIFIIGVDYLAGMTNPRHHIIMLLDIVVAVLGLYVFESYASTTYGVDGLWSSYFLFCQAEAIIFFMIIYFSAKTYRSIAQN